MGRRVERPEKKLFWYLHQVLLLYPRCLSSTEPVLLPMTMTSRILLLPIKKGTVSKFYSGVSQRLSRLVGSLERNRIGILIMMKMSKQMNAQ